MYCIKCGTQNNDAAVYCKYCGERMQTAAEPAPRPQVQAPALQPVAEGQPTAAYMQPEALQYAYNGQFEVSPKSGKRKLLAGIAACVAVVVIAAVLLLVLTAAPVYGNTAMNLNNGGLAAENDGWIYYCNTGKNFSLYKIRTDGTDKTRLSKDASDSINVAGGWVYYRCFLGDNANSICKVRTDGTGREIIKKDAQVTRMFVYGDWIYYMGTSEESPRSDRYLYKIRTDGSDETRFDEQPAGDAFSIAEGWIYYRDASNSNNYKMRLDGTDRTKLDGDYSYLTLTDGWIYYNDEGSLTKVREDGTGKEVLTDDLALNINAADGWIYYTILTEGDCIYRVRTDGTGREKLNDEKSSYMNVAGGWVYYYAHGLYRMRPDGSENELVD